MQHKCSKQREGEGVTDFLNKVLKNELLFQVGFPNIKCDVIFTPLENLETKSSEGSQNVNTTLAHI